MMATICRRDWWLMLVAVSYGQLPKITVDYDEQAVRTVVSWSVLSRYGISSGFMIQWQMVA